MQLKSGGTTTASFDWATMDSYDSEVPVACRKIEDKVEIQEHEIDIEADSQRFEDSARRFTSKSDKPKTGFSAWQWEAISLIACIGIFSVVFVTLFQYEDQDLPSWPLSLSLNSLIAIYTTIIRALLMFSVAEVISQYKWLWFREARPLLDLDNFDRASRGVWGSLRLLFLSSRPNLAVLGATVSIISLAIGPFAQQAIKTHLCERPVPGLEGNVPTAHIYGDDFYRLGAGEFSLSPESSGAILNGLLSPSTAASASSISASCPNGNCTFEDLDGVTYSSIGICSQCTDLTSEVQQVQNDTWQTPAFGLSTDLYVAPNNEEGPFFAVEALGSQNAYEASSYEVVANTRLVSVTLANCTETTGNLETNLVGLNGNVSCQHDHPGLESLSQGYNVVAAECSFQVCLKNYQGRIINGKLIETVVSTQLAGHDEIPEVNITDSPLVANYTTVKEPCIVDGAVYDSLNFSSVSANNHTFLKVARGSEIIMVPEECVYKVPNIWAAVVGFMTNELFTGSCFWNPRQSTQIYCEDKWWLSTLYGNWNASFESVSQHFEDIAASLTNRMREYDGTLIQGNAFQTTICIEVDWQWLIMPAGVGVLAILFFLLGVWQTYRSRVPVWKSSSLPLVFYGPPDAAGTYLSQPKDLKHLQSKARKIKMVCEDNESSGYGFHDCELEPSFAISLAESIKFGPSTPHLPSSERGFEDQDRAEYPGSEEQQRVRDSRNWPL